MSSSKALKVGVGVTRSTSSEAYEGGREGEGGDRHKLGAIDTGSLPAGLYG